MPSLKKGSNKNMKERGITDLHANLSEAQNVQETQYTLIQEYLSPISQIILWTLCMSEIAEITHAGVKKKSK